MLYGHHDKQANARVYDKLFEIKYLDQPLAQQKADIVNFCLDICILCQQGPPFIEFQYKLVHFKDYILILIIIHYFPILFICKLSFSFSFLTNL